MTTIAGLVLIGIFLFLSGIHVYWAFGGQWGNESVIPTKDNITTVKMPGFLPTFVVALGLFSFGAIVLFNIVDLDINLPFWIKKYGLWIITSIFTLRAIGEFHYVGFFKTIKHTKFGKNDTKYFSPLCLIIGTLTLLIELTN